MEKKDKIITDLPIIIDKERTFALFREISENSCDFEKNAQWKDFCNNLDDDEQALFEKLCIDPLLCLPIVENEGKKLRFECMFAVAGRFTDDSISQSCAQAGRIQIFIKKSNEFIKSGILDIVAFCETENAIAENKAQKKSFFEKIAYFKAKKDTEFKIKIEAQKKLSDVLKSKGISQTPLSSSEAETYMEIWFEIFSCSKKIPREGIAAFFACENYDFKTQAQADAAFDAMKKQGANILLPKIGVGAKTVNAARFKSNDAFGFSEIVVTAQDFSWTYCHKNGKTYFYKLPDKK